MADDGNDFMRSMGIATSGLRAQAGRMRVISENIANADSTAPIAGGDPYRRSSTARWTPRSSRSAASRRTSPRFASNTSRTIRRRMPPATSNTPTSIRWSK